MCGGSFPSLLYKKKMKPSTMRTVGIAAGENSPKRPGRLVLPSSGRKNLLLRFAKLRVVEG